MVAHHPSRGWWARTWFVPARVDTREREARSAGPRRPRLRVDLLLAHSLLYRRADGARRLHERMERTAGCLRGELGIHDAPRHDAVGAQEKAASGPHRRRASPPRRRDGSRGRVGAAAGEAVMGPEV